MTDKLYEYFNRTGNVWQTVGGTSLLGQTFTIGITGPNEQVNLRSIKLKCYRVGSIGDITVRLYDTIVFDPSDPWNRKLITNEISSGTIDGDDVTIDNSGEWIEISMTSVDLQPETQYFFSVESDSQWLGLRQFENGGSGYSGGSAMYTTTGGLPAWNYAVLNNCDTLFEVWGVWNVDGPTSKSVSVSERVSPSVTATTYE